MAKLTTIEGIGATGAAKLAKAKVGSTSALLTRGATAAGRRELSKASGVTEKRLLEWVNRADLMRITGVGEEYSDLLEASGSTRCPSSRSESPRIWWRRWAR